MKLNLLDREQYKLGLLEDNQKKLKRNQLKLHQVE